MVDKKTTAYIENVARLKVQFEHAGKTYTGFRCARKKPDNRRVTYNRLKLLTLFQNMLEDAVTNLCY